MNVAQEEIVIDIGQLTSVLIGSARTFRKNSGRDATDALSRHLRALSAVTRFRISPTGD